MRRLLNSAVAMTWLNQVVSFGWMLMVLPLVLRQWNSTEVSLWLSFSLLISLGLLADLGFRPTIARAVSYAAAGIPLGGAGAAPPAAALEESLADRLTRFGRLVGTIRRSYWVLSGISLFLCLFPGVWVVQNIITLGGNRIADWCAYGAAIAQVVVTMNLGRHSGIMEGLDKVAVVNRIQVIFSLVRLVLVIGMVAAGQGVLAITLLGAMLLVVQDGVLSMAAKRAVCEAFGGEAEGRGFDRALFQWLWAPAWRSGVISAGGYLIGQGTTVVAAQLPDPAIIASYLLTMRVLGFAGQIIRTPIYARLPHLNRLRAQQEVAEFRRFFSQRVALMCGLGIVAVLGINFVGGPLLDMVAKSKHGLLEGAPLWILSLWMLLESHHSAHAQAYMTTNDVPFMWPALLSGMMILCVGWFAIQWHGVLGLSLVLLLVQSAFNNWYPVYLNLRSLQWRFWDYTCDLLAAPAALLKHKPIV